MRVPTGKWRSRNLERASFVVEGCGQRTHSAMNRECRRIPGVRSEFAWLGCEREQDSDDVRFVEWRRFARSVVIAVAVLASLAVCPGEVQAQVEFERPPINYNTAPVHDRIADLQRELAAGTATLEYDQRHGYLPAVLKRLDVPVSSQVLVFSKTSLQLSRISPRRPRALYFNDDIYLGWVQNGDVLEVMAQDPEQGSVFYTLSQRASDRPRFIRDRGQCLTCHASSRTQGVPGPLVRSVFSDRGGQPLYGSGTFTNDHRSPFEERGGGWYVTGTHGAMRHMGNMLVSNRNRPEDLNRDEGANVTDLSDLVNTDPYLSSHSDLVALLLLQHQSQMHNYITHASFETRHALHYDQVMNQALDRGEDFRSDSTKRRIAAAGEKLLKYLLFSDEFQQTDPVAGTSEFAAEFQARGPRDRHGRSLRDLDLQTRLLQYPCSYLIYSPTFDRLPAPLLEYVSARLREILMGQDDRPEFAHLTSDDRTAILEILQETKPSLFPDSAR